MYLTKIIQSNNILPISYIFYSYNNITDERGRKMPRKHIRFVEMNIMFVLIVQFGFEVR